MKCKRIKTEDYVAHDGFVDLPYSDEVKEKMELYGYYGRDYPGHDDVKYSIILCYILLCLPGI